MKKLFQLSVLLTTTACATPYQQDLKESSSLLPRVESVTNDLGDLYDSERGVSSGVPLPICSSSSFVQTALRSPQQEIGADDRSHGSPKEDSLESLRTRAVSLSVKENHGAACLLWKEIFENYPECYQDPESCREYGISSSVCDDRKNAERFLLRYLNITKNVIPLAYGALAYALCGDQEKLKQAAKYFECFFSLEDPKHIESSMYANAFNTFYRCGNPKAALKYFDLFLKSNRFNPVPAAFYDKAAECADAAGNSSLAIAYRQKYFSMHDPKLDPRIYASAAYSHADIGEYDVAIDYLEKYLEFNTRDNLVVVSSLRLGSYYAMKGEIDKACQSYDRVFKNRIEYTQNYFSHIDVELYMMVARVYYMKDRIKDAKKVMSLFSQMNHGTRRNPYLENMIKRGTQKRGTARTSKSDALSHLSLKKEINEIYKKKLDNVLHEIEKIDLSEMADMDTERSLLTSTRSHVHDLARDLNTLAWDVDAVSSLPAVYTQIIQLEGPMQILKRAHQRAVNMRQKSRVASYLRTLYDTEPRTVFVPPQHNLRATFGHAKSKESQLSSSSTSLSQDGTKSAPSPVYTVSFYWLKNAQKQYHELVTMPGMLGIYHRFIDEIRQDPLQLAGTSGRAKLLQGEANLFARRFNKQDRFVYFVNKTGDNAYDVTILSLLKHYKNLNTHVQTAKKSTTKRTLKSRKS